MSCFYIGQIDAVFVHIPKTGGLSIRSGVYGGKYQWPVFDEPWPSHWPKDRVFAFVREPMDRFASGVAYCRKYFPVEWAQAVEWLRDKRLGQRCHKHRPAEFLRHHLIPQTHPYNRIDTVTHLGRFEALQDEFDRIAAELGIEPQALPTLNSTDRPHWRDAIPAELIPEIVDIYAEDFDRLGYPVPDIETEDDTDG